jgi:folylpolyglutamate synthase/dihydropteroate synthase
LGGGVAGAARRLQQLQQGLLPEEYCQGLARAAWPGRSQVGGILLCSAGCSCVLAVVPLVVGYRGVCEGLARAAWPGRSQVGGM